MDFKNLVLGTIRTVVPSVVALVIAWLAGIGIEVDSGALTAVLTGLLIGVYYVVARLLEKVHPWFGVLLGVTKEPTYTTVPGQVTSVRDVPNPRQDMP